MGATSFRKSKNSYAPVSMLTVLGVVALALLVVMASAMTTMARADNFTDIFYTNSFRGAFEWFRKLDWVGMIVQMVISCFSLFGVALLVIRIMTSMLYLSAKGMWEEVHDLKSGGGEAEKDLFGMLGMAKSWVQGKSGTGLDAIVGAVLLLLPDVKKYSDFGEKAGGDFSDDMNITQYILKIALPTIMTVFFFAMGFNGTLFQFLAVTVDAMGTVADKAISVNYSGMIDDMLNRGVGYNFTFQATGTKEGKYKQGLAKDIYGRAVSGLGDLDANSLDLIGKAVESQLQDDYNENVKNSKQITEEVRNGLSREDEAADEYWAMLGYEIVVNSSAGESGDGHYVIDRNTLLSAAGLSNVNQDENTYYHIYTKQTTNNRVNYFNLGE